MSPGMMVNSSGILVTDAVSDKQLPSKTSLSVCNILYNPIRGEVTVCSIKSEIYPSKYVCEINAVILLICFG